MRAGSVVKPHARQKTMYGNRPLGLTDNSPSFLPHRGQGASFTRQPHSSRARLAAADKQDRLPVPEVSCRLRPRLADEFRITTLCLELEYTQNYIHHGCSDADGEART